MVVLKNKTRQPQVFNLDAPFFIKNANETPFGQPCSLTFLALEKREVEDAVLACEEIKAAIAAKPRPILRIVQGTVKPVAEKETLVKAKAPAETEKSARTKRPRKSAFDSGD